MITHSWNNFFAIFLLFFSTNTTKINYSLYQTNSVCYFFFVDFAITFTFIIFFLPFVVLIVIFAVPFFFAVTTPFDVMAAIFLLLDLYVTFWFAFAIAALHKMFYVK